MARATLTPLRLLYALASLLSAQYVLAEEYEPAKGGQCRWTPLNPQHPQERAVCPPLVDDVSAARTGSFAPWTNEPLCFDGKDFPRKKYCTYTSVEFRGRRGISLVSTPDVAASLARAIDDAYLSWEYGIQSYVPQEVRKLEESLWEIVDVPGKGKGVIAKRTIEAGEVLLLDYPVLLLSMTYPTDIDEEGGYRLLYQAVEALPQKSLIFDLAASTGGGVVSDVVKTNNFGVPINGEAHMALFPVLSRINHACAPYATIRFAPRTLAMEVIAYRTIPKGEEITISYTPLGLDSKRRKSMIPRWGFNCICNLCASKEKTKQSDKRRLRMEVLLDKLEAIESNATKVYELSQELFHLTNMESLQAKLGGYYETVALAYARMGEISAARRLCLQARDFWTVYDSVDMDRLKGVQRFLEALDQASAHSAG